LPIKEINAFTEQQFTDTFGAIFENSAWIAQKAALARPFATVSEVFTHMQTIVENADTEQKVALILEHPELGTRLQMSDHSVAEQKNAGLNALTEIEFHLLSQLNEQYRKKFRFPFIIAVIDLTKHDIIEAIQARIHNSLEEEFNTALQQIHKIGRTRFEALTAIQI